MYTTNQLDIVWIQFNDPIVGKSCRQRMQNIYTNFIFPSWTPITRIFRKVITTPKIVTRAQFPLQIACAQTIHRAQVLTMNALSFDPCKVYQHGLVYTTLSCVRNIKSLYPMHKLQEQNFKVSKKVNNKIQCLTTLAQWKLQHSLASVCSSHFSLCTLNTHRFAFHAQEIAHDYELLQETVLCFQEKRHNVLDHVNFLNENATTILHSVFMVY